MQKFIRDICFDFSLWHLINVLLTFVELRPWGINSNSYAMIVAVCCRYDHMSNIVFPCLTHWGRVTHICVIKLTIIGSDNGLSPDWCQAIIWNNAGILLIGPLGKIFSENLIEILTFSFTKMRLKVSSAKCRPFCLGLNMLRSGWVIDKHLSLICGMYIIKMNASKNDCHIIRFLSL